MACIWQDFSVELWAKGGESMPTSNDLWKKENTRFYGIRVSNKSGIPDALERAKSDGKTVNGYFVEAVKKQLIEDGYLSDNSVYSGPHGRIVK